MRSIVVVAIAVAAGQLAAPTHAGAQVLKKIRDQVGQKVEAARARADSAAVARAGRTMDSTLAKTGRVVDTAVSKIVSSAAGALNATNDDETLATELETGRAVLGEVRFVGTTDQLEDASDPQLERLARLLKEQSAAYLIEGHVDDGGNAAANQALSEKRSAAVKARLVAAGVPADRLFAMGLGATRPPTDPNASQARIEVARMK